MSTEPRDVDTLGFIRFSDLPAPPPRPEPKNPLAADELTWANLKRVEPRLEVLEREIKAVVDKDGTPYFCANEIWYGYEDPKQGFKERLCRLVGWEAHNPRLRTTGAYDLAYDYLYGLLPDCRDCGCLWA
jgi:hypothetical protein